MKNQKMKYIKRFENLQNKILYENNDIVIEILNENNPLNEKFKFIKYDSDKFDKSRFSSSKINDEFRKKYEDIEDTIERHLKNPYKGEFTDKRTKHEKILNFDIKPTKHWYLKFYRKEFEDPENKTRMVNPSLYEGITLIKNNLDLFTKYIVNRTIKNNDIIIIKTKDNSMYTTLIAFDQVWQTEKNNYNIHLLSQFKGTEYIDNRLRVFKMHPNGPLKTKNLLKSRFFVQ